jgi:hypothetical protein
MNKSKLAYKLVRLYLFQNREQPAHITITRFPKGPVTNHYTISQDSYSAKRLAHYLWGMNPRYSHSQYNDFRGGYWEYTIPASDTE